MEFILPAAMGLQTASIFGKRSLQKASGSIAEKEGEIAAKQEELGAIQREADRKGRLVRALASQIATAGTKGISAFEGSPLRILEADIEAEETATERDIFQTKLAALTQRTQGKVRRSLIKKGADIEFIGGMSNVGFQSVQGASVLGGPKKDKQ